PVVKLSTNSALNEKMPDIIDIDTGEVIAGRRTISEMGEAILDRVIQIASGEVKTKAELLSQNDFIPWKRGVSIGWRPEESEAVLRSPQTETGIFNEEDFFPLHVIPALFKFGRIVKLHYFV